MLDTSEVVRESGVSGGIGAAELTLEEELQDLQRRFKNMENERKIFADEAQAQLKRHKALIDKLNRENEQMREEHQLNFASTKSGENLKGTKSTN